MIRILSFDGGPGAMMQIYIIQQIQTFLDEVHAAESQRAAAEGRPPPLHLDFFDQVDLFAGTSDGALMSLYLAKEVTVARRARAAGKPAKTPSEIIANCIEFSNDYCDACGTHTRNLGKLLLPIGQVIELAMAVGKREPERRAFIEQRLRELLRLRLRIVLGSAVDTVRIRQFLSGARPFSDGVALRKVLERELGGWTLGDLDQQVAILCFNTGEWSPHTHRNFGDDAPGASLLDDKDMPLVEAAMSSASMPLLMPIFGGHDDTGFLDGVFAANNPAMCATSYAIAHAHNRAHANGSETHKEAVLDQLRVLSLGITQVVEEANIERHGGLLANLVLFLTDDRDTRMVYSAKVGERLKYIFNINDTRRRTQENATTYQGVGNQHWGWLDYLKRPTFVANMLIHGMDAEASHQCERVLGKGFFRFAPRINMARAMYRLMLLRLRPADTDLPWNAWRCFRRDFDVALPSGDEIENARQTDELITWLTVNWFDPAQVAAAAVVPAAAARALPAVAERLAHPTA